MARDRWQLQYRVTCGTLRGAFNDYPAAMRYAQRVSSNGYGMAEVSDRTGLVGQYRDGLSTVEFKDYHRNSRQVERRQTGTAHPRGRVVHNRTDTETNKGDAVGDLVALASNLLTVFGPASTFAPKHLSAEAVSEHWATVRRVRNVFGLPR